MFKREAENERLRTVIHRGIGPGATMGFLSPDGTEIFISTELIMEQKSRFLKYKSISWPNQRLIFVPKLRSSNTTKK
jgi:hypothetical protein